MLYNSKRFGSASCSSAVQFLHNLHLAAPRLIVKPIWQHERSDQRPCVDAVANPCADDLRPAGPVCSSNGDEATRHILLVEVGGEESSDPCCAEEEDDVEESVVVLRRVALVIARVLLARRLIVLVLAVRVVESRSGKRAGLYSGAQGSLAHVATGFRLLCDETMLVVFSADLGVAVSVRVALGAKSEAVCCCAGGGVGNSDESDNGADDDSRLTSSTGTDQGVALMVVRFHAHSGQGEISAVDGYNGGLGETCSGVDVLYCGVNRCDG